MLKLLNTDPYKRYIADRKIRTIKDTERYLEESILEHHRAHGFGYYKVMLREERQNVGIVGYTDRKELGDVDIGFALLPEFEGKGYGLEASVALLGFGRNELKLKRIVAIVQDNNPRSIMLLKKLGLVYEKTVTPFHEQEELQLFALNFEET